MISTIFIAIILLYINYTDSAKLPIVINTWPFVEATKAAWNTIINEGSRLDAVESGCSRCEDLQCDGTVGFGGSPDDTGETTLDAMIMDGVTHKVGSVSYLRRIKHAISVARKVLEHSNHTLISGDGATRFARMMGFIEEDLSTQKSRDIHTEWLNSNCQPNFYVNVVNGSTQCPPYEPINNHNHISNNNIKNGNLFTNNNHDTIGMIVVDKDGNLASGTSTNGARHKIAGRVGDSPITGSGSYVDNEIGGAAATGDGDILMRFLPAFHAVQLMSLGYSVKESCEIPLRKISKYYPSYQGAMVCVNKTGDHAGSSYGWPFSYSVRTSDMDDVTVVDVSPIGE